MLVKKEKFHNFYSYDKQCQKTAWDTPEYLTMEDIKTLTDLIRCLQNNDVKAFYDLARGPNKDGLFYRILGWPEGRSYCNDYEYCERTAMPGLIRHTLPKLIRGNL